MISIEQAAKRFKNAPKAPAIRFHLRRKLEIARIEKAANKILQGLAKPILCGKCLEFAMDITFIPYHGKPKGTFVNNLTIYRRALCGFIV
jgi:hypothetical protein